MFHIYGVSRKDQNGLFWGLDQKHLKTMVCCKRIKTPGETMDKNLLGSIVKLMDKNFRGAVLFYLTYITLTY